MVVFVEAGGLVDALMPIVVVAKRLAVVTVGVVVPASPHPSSFGSLL